MYSMTLPKQVLVAAASFSDFVGSCFLCLQFCKLAYLLQKWKIKNNQIVRKMATKKYKVSKEIYLCRHLFIGLFFIYFDFLFLISYIYFSFFQMKNLKGHTSLLITFIIWFCGIIAHGQSFETAPILINEILADDPQNLKDVEFIELMTTGKRKDLSLQGYMVLLMKATSKDGKAEIHLVADLWNQKAKNSFFVIGGEAVENVQLTLKSTFIKHTSATIKRGTSIASFFNIPEGKTMPWAVILLYSSERANLKPFTKQPKIIVTGELETVIRKHLIDMTVFGKSTTLNKCHIFTRICPELENEDYLLRHFNGKVPSNKLKSLNRCSSTFIPFNNAYFKDGQPTPGKENDCSGTKFTTDDIEREMDNTEPLPSTSRQSATPEPTPTHDSEDLNLFLVDDDSEDIDLNDVPSCSSSFGSTLNVAHSKMNSPFMSKRIEAAKRKLSESSDDQSCPKAPHLQTSSKLDDTLRKQTEKIESLSEGVEGSTGATHSIAEDAWDSVSHFKARWIHQMQADDKTWPVQTIQKNHIKRWIEFIPGENGKENAVRCRYCAENYETIAGTHNIPALATKEGLQNKGLKKTRDLINHHGYHKVHKEVIEVIKKKTIKSYGSTILNLQRKKAEEQQSEKQKPLVSMLKTVYTEAKLNLPFSAHSAVVDLQKSNGADLGYHHFSRATAAKMVHFMSLNMHETMIKYVTEQDNPISIIVDAATDARQHHYLTILLHTIEDGSPMVYFYGNVMLTDDESANGLYKAIIKRWSEEPYDFLQYMKRRLTGYASDGANVMSGRHGGLRAKFEEFISPRTMLSVHCMAHKLNLAGRKAFKRVNYIQYFEDNIVGVYQFYNANGHKRKNHMRKTVENMNMKFLELNDMYTATRWIASQYLAVQKISRFWEPLVTDLNLITLETNNFDEVTIAKAKGYLTKMKDFNFLIFLHFILDIYSLLTSVSEKMQKRYGLLPEQYDTQEQLISGLTQLKTLDGLHLRNFIPQVECDDTVCRSIDEIIECTEGLKWHNIEITRGTAPRLSGLRTILLDNLIEQLNSYFPPNNFLHDFKIFNPKTLPRNSGDLHFYGSDEVMKIARYFGFDGLEVAMEWQQLLGSLEGTLCNNNREATNIFWPNVMIDEDVTLGEKIKELLQIVLVLPIGSSDAERAFSILSHIKSKRRGSLQPDAIQDLMRIRLNGPTLNEVNFDKFAKKWLEEGNRDTDDPRSVRGPNKSKENLDTIVSDWNIENDAPVEDKLPYEPKNLIKRSAIFS